MTPPLSPELYRPHIGSDFVVRFGDGTTRAFQLTSVTVKIDDEIQLSFCLHFHSPGPTLIQHLYPVQHPQLGEFHLFLVPIQQKRAGIVYEAVFNLLKPEAQETANP
jgi:hypothetical protein